MYPDPKISEGIKSLADMEANDLYQWASDNLANDIDFMSPSEWFLHSYGSNYLYNGDIPDWGLLLYRGTILQTIRDNEKVTGSRRH